MKEQQETLWQADMLERYPMDSNAMVADLDAERLELLLTYVEEATFSPELARFVALVSRRHPKYLRVKELFETFEAYKRIGQNVYERWRDKQVECVYDFCAGHGLLGLLLANRLAKLPVVCTDSERRPAFGHYLEVAAELGAKLDNLSYVESDIADVAPRPRSYLICIHACNELTQAVLDKAVQAGACYAAMPCCIRDGIYIRRINHVDDRVRYAAAVGVIAGRYGAAKITAIDERITNRNLIVLGRAARGQSSAAPTVTATRRP